MKSARVFLWQYGVTPEQVATALRMGREIEQQDTDRFMAEYQEEVLSAELGELETLPRKIEQELQPARDQAQRQLEFWRRRNNPDRIAEFERKVETLTREISETQERLEQARERLDPNGERTEELRLIRTRFKLAERAGRRALDRLVSVVEMDDEGPEAVLFGLDQGELKVSILGWAPGSVRRLPGRSTFKRSFFTEDGTIRNARFDPSNGKIEFEVKVFANDLRTELEATYTFTLFPTDYAKTDDPTDGRVFFTGEVWREAAAVGPLCSSAEWKETRCRRKGVMKLTDSASRR
jgi:hypothetical protein